MAEESNGAGSDFFPLHDAVKNNQMDILEKLLRSGKYEDDLKDADGETALDLAVQLWNYSAIDLLIRYGTKRYNDIKLSEKSEEALYQDDDNSETILFGAVRQKKKDVIKALVNWDVDVNHSDAENNSALYFALNDADLLLFLLDLGFDDYPMNHTLRDAMIKGMTDTVKLLLNRVTWYDDTCYFECCPLAWAIDGKVDKEIIEILLEHGNKCDDHEYLHMIVENYSRKEVLPLMKLFIQNGADINETDYKKNTPLHRAVSGDNSFEKTCLLLYLGANVDAISDDSNGYTALIRAITRKKTKLVKLISLCQPWSELRYVIRHAYNYDDENSRIPKEEYKYYTELISYILDLTDDTSEILESSNLENILALYCVKKLVAGIHVDEDIEEYLWYNEISQCTNYCENELDKLKKENICKNVTYYDILRANRRQLVYFLKKPEVREALVYFKTERFPIYAALLDQKLASGIIYEPFYRSIEEDCKIFQVSNICFPEHVIEKILSYLSLRDLINWDKAKKISGKETNDISNVSNKLDPYQISRQIGAVFCSTLKLF